MRKQWKQCQTLFWGGSEITADGDCSHEIKRCFLLLGRKVMTNVDSILKSRDITLSTKVHLVKAMVFPVVMYERESWTIKKAEHQRIDASELWCWRRLLRVPCTARRSNQCIVKEISPGCSLEGLMLKLIHQYFGHLMWRADSFEKTLMLGKIEGRRRRGWEDEMVGWHQQYNGHGFGWTLGVGDGQGGLVCCGSWSHKGSDMTEWLNWTKLNWKIKVTSGENWPTSNHKWREIEKVQYKDAWRVVKFDCGSEIMEKKLGAKMAKKAHEQRNLLKINFLIKPDSLKEVALMVGVTC